MDNITCQSPDDMGPSYEEWCIILLVYPTFTVKKQFKWHCKAFCTFIWIGMKLELVKVA